MAKKSIIQDKEIIKKFFYVGHWCRDGEFNGDVKLPSFWAPLFEFSEFTLVDGFF